MFKLFSSSNKDSPVVAAAEVASAVSPPPLSDAGRSSRTSIAAAVSERLDVDTQMKGHLWKRDTSGTSSWKLRYVVVKDGFLLYYPEQKENDASLSMVTFDMHPKGVVPLDGVEIETVRTGPKVGMTSALRLTHPSFGTRSLLLCAGDDSERDRWVAVLSASSYV
jgi:PH domain